MEKGALYVIGEILSYGDRKSKRALEPYIKYRKELESGEGNFSDYKQAIKYAATEILEHCDLIAEVKNLPLILSEVLYDKEFIEVPEWFQDKYQLDSLYFDESWFSLGLYWECEKWGLTASILVEDAKKCGIFVQASIKDLVKFDRWDMSEEDITYITEKVLEKLMGGTTFTHEVLGKCWKKN